MINNNEVNIELNTKFIGFGIKDSLGNCVGDKCVGIDKNIKRYISYKSFCQATKGYSTKEKAIAMVKYLQEKLLQMGFDIQLRVTEIHRTTFSKVSEIVICEI